MYTHINILESTSFGRSAKYRPLSSMVQALLLITAASAAGKRCRHPAAFERSATYQPLSSMVQAFLLIIAATSIDCELIDKLMCVKEWYLFFGILAVWYSICFTMPKAHCTGIVISELMEKIDEMRTVENDVLTGLILKALYKLSKSWLKCVDLEKEFRTDIGLESEIDTMNKLISLVQRGSRTTMKNKLLPCSLFRKRRNFNTRGGCYHITRGGSYHIKRGGIYHSTRGGMYIITRGVGYHYVLGKYGLVLLRFFYSEKEGVLILRGGRKYGRRGPDPQILGGRPVGCSLSDCIAIYAGARRVSQPLCHHAWNSHTGLNGLYCILHGMFGETFISSCMECFVAEFGQHSNICEWLQGFHSPFLVHGIIWIVAWPY
ncbi:hypothetical protein VP01_1800g4 [Puccinia sorghi]|uniref:Uncharacterized protein n=1 Tax=Puccinia sorghi TaxID=27349 RepID=A0A0L6VG59_9BASI|nr:hypothetical protein VP01_1800g4 [Puccinia sorghi]